MNYTFIALVENKPGVLNRVASLFRRRNFNIESLAVGRTQNPEVSRMTIVVACPNGDMDAHRIEANLYKLVNVIDVQDVTHQPSVTRDLALIKVMVAPERRAEVNGLAEIFRARIVDVAPDSVIVEITVIDSARHRDLSRADHFHDSNWAEEFDHAFDLVLRAGDLNDQRVGGHVHDAGAEDLGESVDFSAAFGCHHHFDQRQVTGH